MPDDPNDDPTDEQSPPEEIREQVDRELDDVERRAREDEREIQRAEGREPE